MAMLKIEPITHTSSRFAITILGIDPTSHDCLVGQYHLNNDGPHPARWNLDGLMRDAKGGSLDLTSEEIRELVKLARMLGAK